MNLSSSKHFGENSISAAIRAVYQKFLRINFVKELVRRILRKARDEVKSSADTNKSRTETGKPTVQGLTFQEHLQTESTKMYHYLTQIDTAHDVSRNQMRAMSLIGVDCFSRSVNLGCTFMET
eukprot:snap_masked-scaffold_4-processed-gene-10.33-mRNA-1 protein AED:1.00 eAED:1.00 QI:0/0/0/0/1/1/2/0/122